MKRLIPIILSLIIFTQCSNNSKLIDSDYVGNIKIGNTEEEVISELKMYNVKEITQLRQYSKKYYNVYNNKKLILSLRFTHYELSAIQVHDNSFYTNKNIRVDNTVQEVLDRGYRIFFESGSDNKLVAEVSEKGYYFNFQKILTVRSKRVAKYAKILSISVGDSFDIDDVIKKYKRNRLGKVNGNTFYSAEFDLKFNIPDDWYIKTEESFIPKVKELLFVTNVDNSGSLLIAVEKLKSKKIKSGYDYFMISNIDIDKEPISLANHKFYRATIKTDSDNTDSGQEVYCTVKGKYVLLITVGYSNSNIKKQMDSLINSLTIKG